MPRQETRYPRLGEQIDRLIRSLAVVKGWSMTNTMLFVSQHTHYSPDMVHRWRQGKICPRDETLEILTKIGKEEVNLPREWGQSMLNAARYPDTAIIVNSLWGPEETLSIPCNLPSRDQAQLIGRQAEILRLLELLSPQHAASLITVDGIGGVGKTALVLEVAYRCWRASTGEETNQKAPLFDAIIFVSAKQQYLKPDGIFTSNEAKRTLRDISHAIASVLDHFEITYAVPQEQMSSLHKVLGRQRTLLIVDNLETMENKQEIMSFLYELPRSVKVVITTRERVLSFSPIRLEQLSQEEALALIEREAREKEAEISREQALKLYRHIGGIPAALVYAIGQIAGGFSLKTVLERVPKANSDVARFCFEGSLGPLRGQAAHHLLMAIAMFPRSPSREALTHTAGFTKDQIAVEEGLAQLRKLSLIGEQEGRYTMLPLTREYALSELAAHASFEQGARLRWVEWYLNFTEEYGGKDWKDWSIGYDRIEEEWENLLTVFDWCATHELYDRIQTFWQEKQIVHFTHIYGYWDDRLLWLNWLIQAAERRGDWPNEVKAMVDLGSTLRLIDQLEEADRLFQRAWGMHQYVDPLTQLLLIQKIAELSTSQKAYDKAFDWLTLAKNLLDEVIKDIGERERIRRLADFTSRKAFLFFQMRDYGKAKQYYQETFDLAESITWSRIAVYAQNHLAAIAIAQGQLDEAEALLQMSLPLNKDKRLAAFHKQIFASFYQKKGMLEEARRLAREARDDFERLGMKQAIREMDDLLQQLKG